MQPQWRASMMHQTQHQRRKTAGHSKFTWDGGRQGGSARRRRRRRLRRRRHQPASVIVSAVSGGTQLNDIGSYWGCCPEGNSSCVVQQTSPVRWCVAQTGVHQCYCQAYPDVNLTQLQSAASRQGACCPPPRNQHSRPS